MCISTLVSVIAAGILVFLTFESIIFRKNTLRIISMGGRRSGICWCLVFV